MFNLILSIKPNINILVNNDYCFNIACKYNHANIAFRLIEINPIRYITQRDFIYIKPIINKKYEHDLLMYCLDKKNCLNNFNADLIFAIKDFM